MSKRLTQQTQSHRKTGFRSGLTVIATLLTTAVSVAACALPPAPPPRSPNTAMPDAPAASNANDLSGTSWMLASLAGQPPVENAATLNFGADGRAGGTDSCNNYGASYTVDDNTLTFGPVIGTLMACEEPIMAQATAFQQMLAQTKQYAIANGELSLSDADGKVLATFTPQSTDLAGTNWIVTGYNNGKQAVVSVLDGTELTTAFGTDGRVSGNAGCNNFFGPFTQEEQPVKIGPLASTRKLCPDPAGVMEQEAQFLIALESAATYLLDGNNLTLSTADDATAVTLQRAS